MSLRLRKQGGTGSKDSKRGRWRAWRNAAIAGLCALPAGWAFAAGCGARSSLFYDEVAEEPEVPVSAAFCAEGTFDSGPTDLSMLVLLDRSGSMQDDNRWGEVTAALAAFVDDPAAAGLGIGLQYYPLSITESDCSPEAFAQAAVPIGKLPGNGPAVKASLSGVEPFGETPTLPALRGGVQYARGVAIANPKERVVIALVTDGAPNACESTAEAVAAAEQDAQATAPKVLTYVIGLATGYTDEIALMASAGGTGKPILVDDGAAAAQKIVDAMLAVKVAQESCKFGVPIPAGAQPKATDLSVKYRTAPGAEDVKLSIVADFASCNGDGFYPDDLDAPGSVTLCPTTCAKVHGADKSQVTVTAGCGMGSDGGLPDAKPDSGGCPSTVDFSCVPACGSNELEAPSCVDGTWTCAPGLVSTKTCATCPDVPHGCCDGEMKVTIASCVNAVWTCPPGDQLFGEPGCSPPDVCYGSLPCPFGSYCDLPDDSCGTGLFHGTCKPMPTSCDGAPPKTCGCDGITYANTCEAAKAGADLDVGNECPSPVQTLACGGLWCSKTSQVCRKTTNFSDPIPDTFKCVDIPAGCNDPCSCKLCDVCPPNGPCGACAEDPNGGTYLSCTML